jgi:hypothetical protein
VNLGIFMCLACSGVHRSMGVHISFVKSISLDKWDPKFVANMKAGGNARANAYFEATMPAGYPRPSMDRQRDEFIRQKYEQRRWVAKEGEPAAGSAVAAPSGPRGSAGAAPAPAAAAAAPADDTGGRRRRVPPSQRRQQQGAAAHASPPQQQLSAHEDEHEIDLLDGALDGVSSTAPPPPPPPQQQQQQQQGLFSNMSVKVKNASPANKPPSPPGSPRRSEPRDLLGSFEELALFGGTAVAEAGTAPAPGLAGAGAPPRGADGLLEPFGTAPLATKRKSLDVNDIMSQFNAPLPLPSPSGAAPAAAGAGMRAGNGAGMGGSSGAGATGFGFLQQPQAHAAAPSAGQQHFGNGGAAHSTKGEALQIEAELRQVAGEVEQAQVNLQAFLAAKQTLIMTKARLEQLAAHLAQLQARRLDAAAGSGPDAPALRRALAQQAQATAAAVAALHAHMTQSLGAMVVAGAPGAHAPR